jgi:hypothetical protein
VVPTFCFLSSVRPSLQRLGQSDHQHPQPSWHYPIITNFVLVYAAGKFLLLPQMLNRHDLLHVLHLSPHTCFNYWDKWVICIIQNLGNPMTFILTGKCSPQTRRPVLIDLLWKNVRKFVRHIVAHVFASKEMLRAISWHNNSSKKALSYTIMFCIPVIQSSTTPIHCHFPCLLQNFGKGRGKGEILNALLKLSSHTLYISITPCQPVSTIFPLWDEIESLLLLITSSFVVSQGYPLLKGLEL